MYEMDKVAKMSRTDRSGRAAETARAESTRAEMARAETARAETADRAIRVLEEICVRLEGMEIALHSQDVRLETLEKRVNAGIRGQEELDGKLEALSLDTHRLFSLSSSLAKEFFLLRGQMNDQLNGLGERRRSREGA
ncbi:MULTISPECIES: hypothetical protein [Cohnella]|uniref:hypothetical protein n=1 Tax=Cohnella TaxID=329857 RepID=UPI0009BA9742|nr:MULTISPECIES: hypothetical protein [Cohnella]MBN2980641.1 hypothetical protein [Cohnella algarum]